MKIQYSYGPTEEGGAFIKLELVKVQQEDLPAIAERARLPITEEIKAHVGINEGATIYDLIDAFSIVVFNTLGLDAMQQLKHLRGIYKDVVVANYVKANEKEPKDEVWDDEVWDDEPLVIDTPKAQEENNDFHEESLI